MLTLLLDFMFSCCRKKSWPGKMRKYNSTIMSVTVQITSRAVSIATHVIPSDIHVEDVMVLYYMHGKSKLQFCIYTVV